MAETKITPPECENCGATLIPKEKEGRKFWTCPNWKPNDAGCKGMIWSPPKSKTELKSKQGGFDEVVNALREIYKVLKEIRDKE